MVESVEGWEGEPVLRVEVRGGGGEGDGVGEGEVGGPVAFKDGRWGREEAVRVVVDYVAFEVGGDGGAFLAGFGPVVGRFAWVDDVDRRGGVLRDIVGFHRALDGHLVPVDVVNLDADWPMIIGRVWCLGSCGRQIERMRVWVVVSNG